MLVKRNDFEDKKRLLRETAQVIFVKTINGSTNPCIYFYSFDRCGHAQYTVAGWNLASHWLSLSQSGICLPQTCNISLLQLQGRASISLRYIVCALQLCGSNCPTDVNRGSPFLHRPLFSISPLFSLLCRRLAVLQTCWTLLHLQGTLPQVLEAV